MEEVDRRLRQFGVAVPGGSPNTWVLRASMLNETDNWLILTDCSNAYSTAHDNDCMVCACGGRHPSAGTRAVCDQALQ